MIFPLVFAAGLGTGLSMALAYRFLMARRRSVPPPAAVVTTPVKCKKCEAVFPSREEAREHAKDVHNAFSGPMADAILEEVDG